MYVVSLSLPSCLFFLLRYFFLFFLCHKGTDNAQRNNKFFLIGVVIHFFVFLFKKSIVASLIANLCTCRAWLLLEVQFVDVLVSVAIVELCYKVFLLYRFIVVLSTVVNCCSCDTMTACCFIVVF